MPDPTFGVATAGVVGSIASGVSSGNTSKRQGKNAQKRAKAAAAAALATSQKAQTLNTQTYDQNRVNQTAIYDQNRIDQARINEENKAYMAPYRAAGLAGQNQLLTLMGLQGGNAGAADYGRYAKDFQMSDYQADPGYAYRLQQGIDAMNKTAAARGGLMSGSAIKGGIKFGQDMGSEEYGNAYARYQINRANQLNALGKFASAGQNAAQNTSATNALYGGQMGDSSRAYAGAQNALSVGGQEAASGYLTGGGEARASGYLGAQNSMNQGFSNAFSGAQNALLMNRLFPSNSNNKPYTGPGAEWITP